MLFFRSVRKGNGLSCPLLSIVVPVCRVATGLRKCPDSLVNRMYANLEIMMVDDGSPDDCSAICDGYAKRDARIKVIHQENRGLSGARNAGPDIATGEFVAFVDSDDYLESFMYEKLMGAAVENGADIVVGDFYTILESGTVQRYSPVPNGVPLQKVQDLVLEDRLPGYSGNKIYRRKLFEGVRYQSIRGFEDLQITPRLFQRARKVAFVPEAGYYYNCINMNALTAVFNHRRELNVETKFGMFSAWREHEAVAAEMGLEVAGYAENRAIKCAVSALVADMAHSVLGTEKRRELVAYLDRKRAVEIGRKHRMLRWFARHSPALCKLYDYGSFVWRKYRARRNKLTERA